MSNPQLERLFQFNRFLKTKRDGTNEPTDCSTHDDWTAVQHEAHLIRELHMDFHSWENEQAQRLAIDQHYTREIDRVRRTSMSDMYKRPSLHRDSDRNALDQEDLSFGHPLGHANTYPSSPYQPQYHPARSSYPPQNYERSNFSTFAVPDYGPRRSSAGSSHHKPAKRRSQESHSMRQNMEPCMRRTSVGRDQFDNDFEIYEPTDDEEFRGRRSRPLLLTDQ